MFIFYYISFVMIFYLYSFMRREKCPRLVVLKTEIAWQTVNKPLADCYALGRPPTLSIAVLTATPAAKAPNQLFRA